MYEEAVAFAARAHLGQKRWGGEPFIVHPLRVSLCFKNEEAMAAAVLHDVVEDTDVSLKRIGALFGVEIMTIIDALTRRKGEVYSDYIERASKHMVARLIKIADIDDNMKDGFGDPLKSRGMRPRYEKALMVLRAGVQTGGDLDEYR